MSERHALFFGLDPTQPEYPSQHRAIQARVKGNYRVRCEHCGVSIAGHIEGPGPVTEVLWKHGGSNWFGTFTVLENS